MARLSLTLLPAIALSAVSCLAPPPPIVVDTPFGEVRAENRETADHVAGLLTRLAPEVRAILPGSQDRPIDVWVQEELSVYRFNRRPESVRGFTLLNEEFSAKRIHLQEDGQSPWYLSHELVHALIGPSWASLPGIFEEGLGDVVAEFVDVREDAGSTCGIFVDYLKQAYPEGLDPNEPEHVKLAIALMHGIRSDTRALLEASRLDFEAAAYLWPAVDQALLRKISAQSLNPAVMDMIQAALERRRIYDNFLFSDVGFVRKEYRDGIPQAADFLLTRDGIDTVLVFGIVDGRTVDGSLRTTSDTINPDAFLKKAFGIDEERGAHYGGGNIRDKGGFQIPLGFLAQHKDRDQLYRLACEIIHERFLEAIGRQESDG
jgi:hypothetical protein